MSSSGGRRFAIRTIRGGKIKLNGSYYKPGPDASRFNGMRAAFGLYGAEYRYVSLWGTEEAYRCGSQEEYEEKHWPGPFCEGGYFKWEWWHLVEAR